jgi:hypothetical protein
MRKQPKLPAICANVIELPRDLIPEPITCVVVFSSDPLLGSTLSSFGDGFTSLFVKLTPHNLSEAKQKIITDTLVIGADVTRSKIITAYLEWITPQKQN